MRIVSVLLAVVFTAGIVYGETLEERVKKLEEKVKILEKKVKELEGKKSTPETVNPSDNINDIIVLKPDQQIIQYKVLSKKFKPVRLKESLWQRSDLIILKMVFKNNTGKELKNISGKVVIYDKEGQELMEKRININKALNFFKGMIIAPHEEVKMSVELEYDEKNEKHKKVRNSPLDELVVKFFPTKIEFADGTVKYIKYTGQ
ncbi:hypothetical protein [Persephonella sp.]